MSKVIPSDGRVQILTEHMLREDAFTLRAQEDGPDMRIYESETAEGAGFPLRSDDEIPVNEEEGWAGTSGADGLWVETVGSRSGKVEVLKGVALTRNVRREVEVAATVSSNTYPVGDSFDTGAGDNYPLSFSNDGTIEELLFSIVKGEVLVEISTVDGDTVKIPIDDKATIDSFSAESVSISDPGTAPRIAGGWAGE